MKTEVTVPIWLCTWIVDAKATPVAAACTHKAEVRLVQLEVPQAVEPREFERVASDTPKFSPDTVTIAPPVAAPFRAKAPVTTGESKENRETSVPTDPKIVTAAGSDDPVPGASEHVAEVVELQEVVRHTVCDTAMVAVMSYAQ